MQQICSKISWLKSDFHFAQFLSIYNLFYILQNNSKIFFFLIFFRCTSLYINRTKFIMRVSKTRVSQDPVVYQLGFNLIQLILFFFGSFKEISTFINNSHFGWNFHRKTRKKTTHCDAATIQIELIITNSKNFYSL